MMWIVSFIAVSLAALRNADETWVSIMLMLTLGALGTSVLAVFARHGRKRACWRGFVVFGTAYMLLAFGPWFSDNIRPELGTNRLLDRLYAAKVTSGTFRNRIAMYEDEYTTLDTYLRTHSAAGTSLEGMRERLEGLKEALIQNDSPLTKGMRLTPGQSIRLHFIQFFSGAANRESFNRVGHCIFTLLGGLIGAAISSRLYQEQPRTE